MTNIPRLLGVFWKQRYVILELICNLKLRAAATLSLAKFMLVSETFCENNLQLLFTVLDKSTDPTVRANTIIAAGKLIVTEIMQWLIVITCTTICRKIKMEIYL